MDCKIGGAATTVRTISRYPQWFRNRGLVFCNSVVGDFGESKIGVKSIFYILLSKSRWKLFPKAKFWLNRFSLIHLI
jgi:hypothetical protein